MSNFKTFFKNQKGFSITEVLVAAGLLSIISLGVAALMETMSKEQRRTTLFTALKDTKQRIEANIRDQTSWTNTLNDVASGLPACIRANIACAVPGAPIKIILKDAANNVAFNQLDWSDVGSNGFTANGAACNTFNGGAGAGNDDCIYSYRLVYMFSCPGSASPCVNPLIKITGRLIFNPLPNGVYERYRNLIAQGNLGVADTETDDGKYDASVRRTSATINRFFKVGMVKTGGAVSDCSAAGAGQCSTSLTIHPLLFETSGPTFDNTFSLVTISGDRKSISFNQTGYYSCTANVTAFATQGFTASIVNTSSSPPNAIVGSATVIAGYWSQANAIVETKFNVDNTTDLYQIWQSCDNNNPQSQTGVTDPSYLTINLCTLGMNRAPYATNSTTIVSMSCYRLDRSN